MTNGRKNLNRGGGAAGGSGGERRDLRCQVPNHSSRRYRDAPERCSPRRTSRPPVQTNQPPPPPPPTHARGTRRGGGGGAWSTYAAPPPPQAGNGGSIQVRGGCGRGFRAFWFSVSVDLYAGTLVHLLQFLLQFLAGKLIN